MFFPELNALYLHPGKTAGTSVEKLLLPGKRDVRESNLDILFGWHREKNYYLQHATATAARDELGDARFSDAYRFATVRDPFARMISVYHYLFPHHEKRFGGFRQFVLELPRLARAPLALLGNHYSPQYLFATIDDTPVCNRIIRFEQINEDFGQVATDLNLKLTLKNLYRYRHASFPQGPLDSIYDEDMVAAMQTAYAEDFRFFGYPDQPCGQIEPVRE